MTGLLLIATFSMWVLLVAFISRWTARFFKSRAMKVVSGTVAFGWLLSLMRLLGGGSSNHFVRNML